MKANGRKKVGLALGGAVARGAAHVGVLTALERASIPIDCIAGTSAGALIGSLYCAGVKLEHIKELALQIGWKDVARPVLSSQGFLSFDKLERWLANWLGDFYFEDLALPFAVVATDLETGEPMTFREGPLVPVVRASCSVPGTVVPAKIHGRLLGDGGVTDNLPVAATRALGADYVIGVDLFRSSHNPYWGLFGVLSTTLETLVRKAGGGVSSADCLISPDLAGFSYIRFIKQEELMARGESAVEVKLPYLRATLGNNMGKP